MRDGVKSMRAHGGAEEWCLGAGLSPGRVIYF
jgi:hypothetical protein